MNIRIRKETERDYRNVEDLVQKAFQEAQFSDHSEHLLVSRLRKSNAFIAELSLVAEKAGLLVGHILFSKVRIVNERKIVESLALAPVAVLPEYQNKGVGKLLIREGLRIAQELGFESVIVLGHEHYYPRFGFKPARSWGIKLPFTVPEENFMALELKEGALDDAAGVVEYPQEFNIIGN
ncbi:MAG: N-acetyltransferase [Veillonellaceae bacterium]|jgi:predicted N-acetyltransferase YhbS|nr:N-acetyltransferase [Veillonellaceae bacterium]